jgi:N-methylhydantoinase A
VSAYGLLTVDVRNDYVQTRVARHAELDLVSVDAAIGALTAQARQALSAEGFPVDRQFLERTADLRYFGQAYEVRVPCPPGEIDQSWAEAVADAFHDAHRSLYGYDFRGKADQQVEWVNLRVTGVGPLPRPEIREIGAAVKESPDDAEIGRRDVYFDGWTSARLYERSQLLAGHRIVGPAVVQEFGSTVPIHPGFAATVDPFGNLIVARDPAAGAAEQV